MITDWISSLRETLLPSKTTWQLLRPIIRVLLNQVSQTAYVRFAVITIYMTIKKLVMPPGPGVLLTWYNYSVVVMVSMHYIFYLLPDVEQLCEVFQPRLSPDAHVCQAQLRLCAFALFEVGAILIIIDWPRCRTWLKQVIVGCATGVWNFIVWLYNHQLALLALGTICVVIAITWVMAGEDAARLIAIPFYFMYEFWLHFEPMAG
jgi:hypothetical protein